MRWRRVATVVSRSARWLATSSCVVITSAACTGSSSRSLERGESLSANTTTASFRVVPVADGLRYPLSMAFLPDGSLLVAEKFGTLRRVRDGVVSPTPIAGVPTVYSGGQGGLHDVALHPDFARNGLVYLAFAKAMDDGRATTALARGTLVGDTLRDVRELFVARTDSRAGQHFGGRLAFDGAGHLFLSVGDRGASPSGDLEKHPAQDVSNHQGTIVRLTLDGDVPPDNPFVATPNARPEIWSYGHRNPQGLVYDAVSGTLWETEHGPRGGDELNVVRAGANYGWPVITYGRNYSGTSITSERERAGMEQPVTYWVPSIATSGLLLYTGDAFPAWRGSLFVGGLAGEQLARVMVDGPKKTGEETLLSGAVGRIRDVRQGPDGFIYLALDRDGGPGTIVRLEPER